MLVVVWGSFVVCCGALRGVAVTRRASGRFGVAETRLCAASSSTEVLRCYRASELTLVRYVGEVGVMEVTDWEYSGEGANRLDPTQPARTKRELSDASDGAPVRLFLATVDDPGARARGEDTRVMLREYGGGVRGVAERERDAHARLLRDHAFDDATAPIVRLLGTLDDDERGFFSSGATQDERFVEAWYANLGVDPPRRGALWLVFEWSGVATAASLCAPRESGVNPMLLEAPSDGGGSFRGLFGGGAPAPRWREAQRTQYVRSVMKGALSSVAWLHERGLAHRSLGCTSLALDSSQQDKSVSDPRSSSLLRVKLNFLGFTSPATSEAIAEDLQALGYAFAELVFSPALVRDDYSGPPPPPADQDSLKRLFDDIFDCDIDRLRDYVEAEPAWRAAVELLDAHNGWPTLGAMLRGRNSPRKNDDDTFSFLTARALLSSPLFADR